MSMRTVALLALLLPLSTTAAWAQAGQADAGVTDARGDEAAVKEVGLEVPLVVRLEGTNVDLGKQIINESGLNVIAADDLDDAAQKIVAAVKEG